MIKTILWIFSAIIVIDITINFAIERPKNNIKPSKLSQYFDYGLSTEHKLFRKVSSSDETADALAKAGWYKSHNKKSSKKTNIFIYGMSFSNHIGEIISKTDMNFDVNMYAGPGAPLNHSYAYYQNHRPHKKGDVVILGILASSLPMINTLTHITSNFEDPAAHFYPKYQLNTNNQLIKKQLPINTLSELRVAMHDTQQWHHIKETLKKEDCFYNKILFSKNLTDKSVYFRLLKRAWGQRHKLKIIQRYHNEHGFKNTDKLIEISQSIVKNFAKEVREDGATPIIILFNNRGFSSHLFSILQHTLNSNKIAYYSTHTDFPAENLDNFIPDGHFKHEIDIHIAKKTLELIYSM